MKDNVIIILTYIIIKLQSKHLFFGIKKTNQNFARFLGQLTLSDKICF